MKPLQAVLLFLLAASAGHACAQSGRELIEASLERHAQPPYVYEEETLVLSDRFGQHTVRMVKHYVRRDESGVRSVRVLESPLELRGIEVVVARDAHGGARRGAEPSSQVFGSDFSVADLEEEQPRDFSYERLEDIDLERVPHRVIRALPKNEDLARVLGFGERRIYLRKDNLFVSRIDYQDRQGRLARRETFRDPRPDASGAWHAGMILMENLRDGRRSVLKVERRVHSPDYVPASVFAGLQ